MAARGELKMPDSKEPLQQPQTIASRLKRWLVPAIILLLALGIVVLITTNWNRWAGERAVVGSSRVDLQACKLEYSIVSPK